MKSWSIYCEWMQLLLLHIMYLRAIHVWLHQHVFLSSLFEGHLGCYQFGAIIYKAAANTLLQVFVWMNVFISFQEIPANGIRT